MPRTSRSFMGAHRKGKGTLSIRHWSESLGDGIYRRRPGHGSVPVAQALKISTEIAEAMDAAHQRRNSRRLCILVTSKSIKLNVTVFERSVRSTRAYH